MNASVNPLGSHILLTLKVLNSNKLTDLEGFKIFADSILSIFKLEKVGCVSHVFENNSFTASICLMESHICIHTWPENQNLALDIYLCNYSQDNSQKIKEIATQFTEFFEAETIKQTYIER